MSGLFFAFEGIDGCGKTTQLKILSEKFKNEGHPVLEVREPGGTPLAETIRSVLLDPQFEGMNGWSETFLFCAARASLVRQVILPELAKGTIILADRYRLSTEIYQGLGRSIPLDAVKNVLDWATNSLQPNFTFIFDIPYTVGLERIKKENRSLDRMEQNDRIFFEKIASAFQNHQERNVIHLNGELPIEEISNHIWNTVRNFLHQDTK